ncbi:GCN5-related N-acetyltransferase [Serinicoccus hydrothermalis]|uniref:GCN5-related N-acetyltransferase n=1 Tax=Serinicoccus hydrothermalis TaxID=1758689 RepID=A0A1B1NDZ2_9MICO|nr:GNAT family N-acetyltransferase [Serinicoccus hydrothermalis]ANS79643.1 GCN5-related N-acetyltransferase [Serinicoccus hydrothermalis]
MDVVLRPATPQDAEAVATVRIAGWWGAYPGLLPSSLLHALDVASEAENRRRRWPELHDDPRVVDLVAEVDGLVAGWAVAGPAHDPERPDDGELYGLYVIPRFWSTGLGHRLLVAVEEHLRAQGCAVAHLWVLAGNERAAAFYERHGWLEDGGTQLDRRGGHELLERRRVRDLRQG